MLNIAIHNLHKLPQLADGRGNINGYVLHLIKRGYVRYLYFDDYNYRNSYGQSITDVLKQLFKYATFEDIGLDKVELIFSSKKLRSKCDILLNFNVTREAEFTPAIKRFNGFKVFHLMDYFWIEPASKKNERLTKFGVDFLLSYARSDKYCKYFQYYFPNYIGRVVPVPFGFASRCVPVKPFEDREKKCVALGSANPLNRPDTPMQYWVELAQFYPDEAWLHKFRRMLVLNKEYLRQIMDSMLPEYPQTMDYTYDIIEKYNEYQMFVSCDTICHFPGAKTWEGPASGCVLVCSDHPCYNDFGFIDGINCIKHNENDIADFRNKVSYYINNQDKLKDIQKTGTDFVRKNYTHEAIADKLYLTLKDIYEKKSSFDYNGSTNWFNAYTMPDLPAIQYYPQNITFIRKILLILSSVSPIISLYEIIKSPSRLIRFIKGKIGMGWGRVENMLTRLRRFLRKPWDEKCEAISARISSLWIKCTPWLVYPIRTRHGIWIWTRSDVTGLNLRRDRELDGAESLFVKRFLRPGMNVLDIGANIGYFSTLASKLVGAQGTVVAFEPSPRERHWLQRNLTLNHCQNVRVEKMGLGKNIGEIDLFVVLGRETGCNSMRPPDVNEPVNRITVPITTIDNYLSAKNFSVDFVKMDIEGADLSALEGASSLLASTPRPIWLCELVDLRTAPWGYRAVSIYDFLARSGYHWFSVLPNGSLERCARKEQFHENLVAAPEERLPEMQDLLEIKEST